MNKIGHSIKGILAMVFVFEISSPESVDFRRKVQIRSDETFESLHQIVQDVSDFDSSQVASFFIADEHWHKKIEIGQLTPGEKSSFFLSMYNCKLEDHIFEIGQKLVYVFDFFNDRFFYIELKEKLMKTDLKEPFVAYERGNAPAQFLGSEYEETDVELVEREETYRSFGDLEDYYEIFGEIDA